MAFVTRLVGGLVGLLRRTRLEQELDDELQEFLETAIEDKVRSGMSRETATRAARMELGSAAAVKDHVRDVGWENVLETMWQDVRYATRTLRRSPGFTLLASLTLAVGIGATTALFSVVRGVLIKPLPYPDSERLIAVWQTAPGLNAAQLPLSASQYLTYREHSRTLQDIGIWGPGPATVTRSAGPEEVRTVGLSDGVLQSLAVPPALGRWFVAEDFRPGSPDTVMLAHGYWQQHGRDPSVVGQMLSVNARPHTVIGVMPEGFLLPDQIRDGSRSRQSRRDLFLPMRFDRQRLGLGGFGGSALARLKPGLTISDAAADVTRMIPLWVKGWPAGGPEGLALEHAQIAPTLRSLKADVVGEISKALWVLMGTIAIVLVIACANVANLQLVRSESRQHELAVRAALGAGWYRLARILLLESVVLSFLGGLLGLCLTMIALRVLVSLAPDGLPRLNEIGIDALVLLFAVIVSALSGLVFGLVVVVRHGRPSIAMSLTAADRRASDSRERSRIKNTLVVAQVALALMLLVAAGLMIRTFVALLAIRPGFTNPEQIQLVRIIFPPGQVNDLEQVYRLQREILDGIALIPGVSDAAFITTAPMGGFNQSGRIVADDQPATTGELQAIRMFKFVTPGLFRTIGTPLLAGRDFDWVDLQERRPVAVISENLAREMWGEVSATVGKRIRELPTSPWREIIGVVANLYEDGVYTPAPAIVYWPALMERFRGSPIVAQRLVAFTVRSPRAGTEAFINELQTAVWAVDRGLPLGAVRTLGEDYARSLARTSFTVVMLAIAASMALLLGVVGIYGVIACTIAQRTREIGIRIALGAPPESVRRMFVGQGLGLAIVGVIGGLAGAALLTRVMSSLLFGIGPLDPVTYAAVPLALIAVAAVASYLSARRATKVDPMVALRAE